MNRQVQPLFVVSAVQHGNGIRFLHPSRQLIPINFGENSEHYSHASLLKGDVDPKSLTLPHYFA